MQGNNTDNYTSGNDGFIGPIIPSVGENNIPHWRHSDAVYHICFRLNDSVPIEQQKDWIAERYNIQQQVLVEHRQYTAAEIERLKYLYSDKVSQYLDAGHGECILKDPNVAQIVRDSLMYFQDQRYKMHCWCIMPNHVHAALEAISPYFISKIVHGWKSFTAHKINKYLQRNGPVWQRDYYNHIIRTDEEYYFQISYIWNNPEKSHLINWPWRWRKKSDDIAKQNLIE